MIESTYKLINGLRLKEIVLMTGFSVVGILFTSPLDWNLITGCKSFTGILFYVISIYALNSLADYSKDKKNSRLKNVSRIRFNQYMVIFFVSFFICVSVSINLYNLISYIIGLVLWSLYYLPPFRLKSTFLWGTIVHFIAGIVHFHMGYLTFGMISYKSWGISVFFGLLLVSGHFHHEIIDFKDDKSSEIQTTTVKIGTYYSHFLRSFSLFAGICLWILLYVNQIISFNAFVVFLSPSVLLFIVSSYLADQKLLQYQKTSRMFFLIAGIIFLFQQISTILLQK